MNQAKPTKTRQKTTEVKDLRNPETKAAERRVGQQRSPKSTEVHKSTAPRRQSTTDFGLSRRRSNELQKGDDRVKNVSYRQAKNPLGGSLPRHTEKSTKKSTEKLTSQVPPTSQIPARMKSTKKSTKIPLKPRIESATRSRP